MEILKFGIGSKNIFLLVCMAIVLKYAHFNQVDSLLRLWYWQWHWLALVISCRDYTHDFSSSMATGLFHVNPKTKFYKIKTFTSSLTISLYIKLKLEINNSLF